MKMCPLLKWRFEPWNQIQRFSDSTKPILVDMNQFDAFCPHANAQLFQFVGELSAVEKIDGRCAVAGGFLDRCRSECSSGDEETFVSPPHHCTSKVPNLTWADGARVSLTLKEHMETHESVY